MNLVPPSLLWSIAASVMLHGALAALANIRPETPALPKIEMHLSPIPAISAAPLLKNTLDAVTAHESVPATAPTIKGFPRPYPRQLLLQKRRLAEHVFYPPKAVEQGLEGEVRLLLRLGADGVLLDARVVSSSGYELLDQAAIAAAQATGNFPGGGRELILPVVFRLSD